MLGALKGAAGAPAPAKGSLLALLWNSPAKAAFLQAASLDGPMEAADRAPAVDAAFTAPLIRLRSPVVSRLAADYEQRAPGTTTTALARLDGDRSDISIDAATDTLVHRYLWRRGPQRAAPGCKRPAWPGCAARDFPTRLPAKLRRVRRALETALRSDTGRWILDVHEEASAEKQLTSRLEEGGGHAKHIIDRTFVACGERWIVDYKTVRCDEVNPRAYLQGHAEQHYREQLGRYASLYTEGGLGVRMAIFYVLQGELVELDRNQR